MKTAKLKIGLILILLMSQITLTDLLSQTLTETFATNNFPASAGNGSFVGVNGTVWTYKRTMYGNTATPARMQVGGSLSALFTKKISNVSLKAVGWSSTIPSVFEIFINNNSRGTLSFLSATETKSISLSSGCDTSLLTIRVVSGWYYGGITAVAVSFDTLLADDAICGSPYINNVHSSFGNDPKTQMIISWSSPVTDANSYVIYGATTSYGSVSTYQSERVVMQDTLDSVFVVHHVTLTGLTPGTKYHYRCGGSAGLSNDCIFRTAPAGIQPYTFVLIADIQNSSFSSPFNSCAKYMKEQDVSFVVQLGDIVQNGCYVNEWNNLFESGKPIFDNAPFMVCIGTNHDVGYQGIEANFCQDIFKFPSNKTLSQYRSLWYSFEYSNSVFTSMYTESNLNLQKPFMDSVFKNTTCPWKFSYWHTNPYSTGGHGGDGLVNMLPNFLAVVDTYNIATVFNGHSHAYEFTHPILKVGNPPVISNATVNWSTRKATANHSQGTVFYNGAGFGGSAMNTYSAQGLPQQFTLTGDSAGGDYTLLLGTVYSDSIVYKVVYYQDCKTFKKGDVLFTYKIINDAPGTKYTLTVNSGSGSGNYNASTPVVITASAPASGKVFDKWTGDVTNVANINAASTTITMPAANTVITATYKDAPPSYTLTVNSGSGSGSYTSGAVVNIIANTPTVGKVFDKWTGDVTGIANVNASSTTITMPASAAGITATYKDAPPNTYTLTVTSGTGSGNYTAGTVVNITANAPATGKIFDKWTGDITGIADVNNSSTIITIPAVNIGIAALYKDIENALREENSRVKIYPNPASDILIIETEGLGEAIIKIVDMTGNTLSVIKSNETEKLKLSVSHLVDGVYIIEIMHNNSVKYIKLCKQ